MLPLAVLPFENTSTSSKEVIGLFLAFTKLPFFVFTHIHLYLYISKLDWIILCVNRPLALNTISAISGITLSLCAHNDTKGMILSHEQAIVSYGNSHKIISTDLSGIFFIPSQHSSLYILFSSTSSTRKR